MRVEMQMLIMLRNMENNQELMELSLEPVLIQGAPTRDPQCGFSEASTHLAN